MNHSAGMHTDHAVMDGEHRVQMTLISSLEGALEMGAPPAEVRSLLGHLVEYSNVHFMSELMLMRFAVYPGLRGHEEEHTALMERFKQIQAGLAVNDSRAMIAQSQVLRQLLLDHIHTHDLMFSEFLGNRLSD